MKANHTMRTKSLSLAERTTRAWNAGCFNAYRRGTEYFGSWLAKYSKLMYVPVWPEEFLKIVEERYGLH